MDTAGDIESFLKSVDTISELVCELKSSDPEVQHKAIQKADCYVASLDENCSTKVNKTTINTQPASRPSTQSLQSESPENFMKIMERDAEDRRMRRITKAQKATELKDKGNEAYAKEDYKTAVKYYSDGLAELRDMQPLYTNRAQAYIKLGQYKEAISDCEWALRCNERCIKAYLHMGKAYLALKKYNEARNCFEKVAEIEPGKERTVKVYLTQVDVEEERANQEISAMREFEKGDTKATTVPKLLEKLSRPDQMPCYYSGGFEILSQAITDCTGQTLFRLNNGFSIISSNDTVRSCLVQETKDADGWEMCASTLRLWRTVCCGNAENQRTLMSCPLSRRAAVGLVASERAAVRAESLALLHLYSQTPRGRCLAADSLDVHALVKNLMACITKPQQPQQGNTAASILKNFTAEHKCCVRLRDVLTDAVIVPFTAILRRVGESDRPLLPSLIAAVANLARDDVICGALAHDPECWTAFLIATKRCATREYGEVLYPLLGLIFNLSNTNSPVIQDHAVPLCDCCLGLLKDRDGGVVTRAAGVLSAVLPQSSEAVERGVQGDLVRTMRHMLKGTGPSATKYAMKTLAVCTAASRLAREELLKSDRKLSVLRRLLGSSCDEMVLGNAAQCLAQCLELEGIASDLLGTDIVALLLRHAAGDANRAAVRLNAAIALGKLCTSERRHVKTVRELNGFEILHSYSKMCT